LEGGDFTSSAATRWANGILGGTGCRALWPVSSTLLHMDATIASRQLCHVDALEVAVLAKQYCDRIESSAYEPKRWLKDVVFLLPRLHAAVASVAVPSSAFGQMNAVDLDERFELFSRLRKLLADRDAYWLEFDRASEGADGMTGSLADDLTDIYCELKLGLRLYDQDPVCAVTVWAVGFDSHWGRHLVDAERHLARLAAEDRLEA